MKKLSILACLLLSGCNAHSQVGIPAETQRQAILQCKSQLGITAPATLKAGIHQRSLFVSQSVVRIVPSDRISTADAARINACAADALKSVPRNLGCTLTLVGGDNYACSR